MIDTLFHGRRRKKIIFPDVILDSLGDPITAKVRQSNRARNISIRIIGSSVELVMPNQDIEFGRKLLLKKESWIRKKIHILDRDNSIDPNIISILGKKYKIEHICADHYKVELGDAHIKVYSTENHHNKTLIKFLKDKLLVEIKNIVLDIAENYNLSYSKIRIMNNKTKWGSCSSKGVLSFHWRMIFAPQNVLHYLIIHEMCHLVHMNHSKDFWNLVQSMDDDYKSSRLWLKKNGALLYAYLN